MLQGCLARHMIWRHMIWRSFVCPWLAAVVLACRSRAKGEALKAEIEAECAAKGLDRPEVEVRLLDLASLE